MNDRYHKRSNLVFGHLSDEEVAGKVRMLMRNDLDHEAVCTGARDRIMYLSNQLDQFVEAEKELMAKIEELEQKNLALQAEFFDYTHETSKLRDIMRAVK